MDELTGQMAAPEERPQEHPAADDVPEPPAAESVAAGELLDVTGQPANAVDAQRAELKAVLEAVVYVLNDPMPAAHIAQALGRDPGQVDELLRELVEETAQAHRGIFVREVAGGFQLATKPEHHEALRQFVSNLKQPLKLSQAALETLAVIAYKQPITLPEILEIRGVQGGGVLKTLIDRKLVTTAGRKAVVGKPMLYKTTKDFLTQFGLKDVAELPSLKEFEEIRRQSMADDEIEPAHAGPALEPASEFAPESAPEAVTEAAPEAQPEPALESQQDPAPEANPKPASEPAPQALPEPARPTDEEPRTDG